MELCCIDAGQVSLLLETIMATTRPPTSAADEPAHQPFHRCVVHASSNVPHNRRGVVYYRVVLRVTAIITAIIMQTMSLAKQFFIYRGFVLYSIGKKGICICHL
jgi:hypothetical protein